MANLNPLMGMGLHHPTAVVLFGSRARGDASPSSDVDLLIWTEEDYPRHSSMGNLSLSFYPRLQLLEKARAGDLFIGHVVHEGRLVYDPYDLHSELRASYKVCPNLSIEASKAADLGYLLIDHASQFDDITVNRRMAWVTRSLLIAKSVEDGKHVYAAGQLAELFQEPDALKLIAAKDEPRVDPQRLLMFRRFLTRWSPRREGKNSSATLKYYRALFNRTSNSFGSKTLRSAIDMEQNGLYS